MSQIDVGQARGQSLLTAAIGCSPTADRVPFPAGDRP